MKETRRAALNQLRWTGTAALIGALLLRYWGVNEASMTFVLLGTVGAGFSLATFIMGEHPFAGVARLVLGLAIGILGTAGLFVASRPKPEPLPPPRAHKPAMSPELEETIRAVIEAKPVAVGDAGASTPQGQ